MRAIQAQYYIPHIFIIMDLIRKGALYLFKETNNLHYKICSFNDFC
jgi:hypothetical protein